MKYMTTYKGEDFAPTKPEKDKIIIEDIAHALSLMCRGNGHLKHFYSVAQHSINCCYEAKERGYSQRVQLMCLLHDASEAYIADITRPVKSYLKSYLEFEEILQTAIYEKFVGEDISEEELLKMKEIDDAILYFELNRLMSKGGYKEEKLYSDADIELHPFEKVENQFLELFKGLTK